MADLMGAGAIGPAARRLELIGTTRLTLVFGCQNCSFTVLVCTRIMP